MKVLKKVSLLLFVCLGTQILNAQIQVDTSAHVIKYQEIVEIDLSQDQLRKETEKWFAITFKDSKEVIRLSNEDNVIAKGYYSSEISSGKYTFPVKYQFTVDVAFKKGRYKLEIYDLSHQVGNINVEVPIIYIQNPTIKDLELMTLEMAEKVESPSVKKAMIKRVEKGKIGQEDLDKVIEGQEQMMNNLKDLFYSISQGLKSHLDNAENDNW